MSSIIQTQMKTLSKIVSPDLVVTIQKKQTKMTMNKTTRVFLATRNAN